MSFDEANFKKKKWTRGVLYFIDGFDFQRDIPGREKTTEQDFIGKKAILEFSQIENIRIFVTNKDIDTNFQKVAEDAYLISINRFIRFHESLKNKTGVELAHAFFTNQVDIKNTYFSKDDYRELIQTNGFKDFIATLSDADRLPLQNNTPGIKNFDLSLISSSIILSELEKRDLNTNEFFNFASRFLKTKDGIKNDELKDLVRAIDFKKIKNTLDMWEQNKTNSREIAFWHPFLRENSWILSQVFAAPSAIFQNEFFVGGHHSGSASGSKNTDFGFKNKFSQNTTIIEIKTPMTHLVDSSQYGDRLGIYPMHKDLMGSISQVLNQKDNLQKDFLQNNKGKDFEVWNPKIILIIGSEKNEKLNQEQRACFELFKHGQKELEIITFDELFEKIKNLEDIFKPKIEHDSTT